MSKLLTRRHAASLLAGTLAAPFVARNVFSQGRSLDIRGGSFTPVQVAVTDFVGDAQQGSAISDIITSNFKRSVYLAPLDKSSFAEKPVNPDAPPNWDAWKIINAQFVATGRTGRGADGRLRTEFRLWDVATRQQVAGQQYVTDPQNSRRVAHLVSDAIFTKITGEGPFFDTRVVFVDETGARQKRRKRLAIMDQDGANIRYLTTGDDLVLTPRFSPSSQDVTYMAFGDGDAKVYLMNVQSGQREVVGNFPGMTFAPRFAPDGQRIVMSLATGSNTNLFAMDLRSRSTTRLTDTSGIDTSPSYSPDGSQIVFESDRGGSQQLYIMPSGGGGAKRISFGQGARYSTPVWSPNGDYIAFTRQRSGSFAIGVMKPDGSSERIIADGFHNEGPTWAPNGLYVMFFRDPGGGGGSKIYMANITGRGESIVQTPSFASDPSWSPLIR